MPLHVSACPVGRYKVTFQGVGLGHHHYLVSTKLYCLVIRHGPKQKCVKPSRHLSAYYSMRIFAKSSQNYVNCSVQYVDNVIHTLHCATDSVNYSYHFKLTNV